MKQEQPDSTTGLKKEQGELERGSWDRRGLEGGSKGRRELDVWNNRGKRREREGESSGEEDDALDAIDEWQQE